MKTNNQPRNLLAVILLCAAIIIITIITAAVASAQTIVNVGPGAEHRTFKSAIDSNRKAEHLVIRVADSHDGGRVRLHNRRTTIEPADDGGWYIINGGGTRGVAITGSDDRSIDMEIRGAHFQGCSVGAAIQSSDKKRWKVNHVKIIDCIITDTREHGVYLEGIRESIELRGNVFNRCGLASTSYRCLYAQEDCTPNVISTGNVYGSAGSETQFRPGVKSDGDVFLYEGVAAGVVRGNRDPRKGGVQAEFINTTIAFAGWHSFDLGNLTRLKLQDVFIGWPTDRRGGGEQRPFQLTGVGHKDFSTVPIKGAAIDVANIVVAWPNGRDDLVKVLGDVEPTAVDRITSATMRIDRVAPVGVSEYLDRLTSSSPSHTIDGLRRLLRGDPPDIPDISPTPDPTNTGELATLRAAVEKLNDRVKQIETTIEHHNLKVE